VDTKPAYRDAFARRRCLVPIEAFYERKKLGPREKQPYAIALAGGGFMALAGLWENWKALAASGYGVSRLLRTSPSRGGVFDLVVTKEPAPGRF
jgi:putative SOS response-associated peptidase YedK